MKGKILFSCIVSMLCFSLSSIGIMGAMPKQKKALKDEDVVVKSNVEEMSVETTVPFVPETEIVTEKKPQKKLKTLNVGGKKKKKKKKKKQSSANNNYNSGYDDYDYDYGYDDYDYGNSGGGGGNYNYNYSYNDGGGNYSNNGGSSSSKKKKNNTNKNNSNKQRRQIKPKIKKKAIPAQSEKNALSSGAINTLRKEIAKKMGGSKNTELTRLAIYMANNHLSNAASTYRKLTNVAGGVSCATYNLKVSTNDELDILNLANKINSVSGGNYGIGISSSSAAIGYKIYVVIVYR